MRTPWPSSRQLGHPSARRPRRSSARCHRDAEFAGPTRGEENVMPTIDVQVHAYEGNHPARPWVGHIAGPASVSGDEMVAAMDAVGVDGAILVSPFSLYRYDASY